MATSTRFLGLRQDRGVVQTVRNSRIGPKAFGVCLPAGLVFSQVPVAGHSIVPPRSVLGQQLSELSSRHLQAGAAGVCAWDRLWGSSGSSFPVTSQASGLAGGVGGRQAPPRHCTRKGCPDGVHWNLPCRQLLSPSSFGGVS